MDYEKRISELEKEVKALKEANKYKKCPLCYGEGYITSPSKENDYTCWTCGGSGKVERRD